MQVILMAKNVHLGELGEVVSVKPGYARNYLIPQGKARRATAANLKEFEVKREALEREQAQHLQQAQQKAHSLSNYKLTIVQKAGVDGKLFGSVGSADIAEALTKAGHSTRRAEVRLPSGPLKAVGEHPVSLHLHTEVNAEITVAIVGL